MAGTTGNTSGYVDDAALSGIDYGFLVDTILESVPELLHPLSVRTFARMRHEPQLAAILRVYKLAIARAQWSIDPAGCRDEVAQRIADDLGLPIKGADSAPAGARRRNVTWTEHLRVSLLDLDFGHMGFEQEWAEQGGAWRLVKLAERMPQTIDTIKVNDDGEITSVVQVGRPNGQRPVMKPPTLVWYANDREGSNWFGTSLLRPSFAAWLIKDQIMRVWPTSNRRNGMGIWQVQAPAGATPQQIAEAQRIASTTKASEFAGIGLPAGFTAELKGLSGTLPDHKELADYLDRQMTRSTLTSILDMATAERGARSLGETVMQLMVYAQQAVAERHAIDATRQIVIPLVDANWGEDEPAPRIDVADVGVDDQLTAQDMNWLMQYGGINPDDTLEEDIRRRKGLPKIDHTTRRLEITEAVPADPNALPEIATAP